MTNNHFINSGILSQSSGHSLRGLHTRFPKEWLHRIAPEIASLSDPDGYDTYQFNGGVNRRKLLAKCRKAEYYGMLQKTLFKVDRASMANSIEVRVPFLKKTMISASLTIDP